MTDSYKCTRGTKGSKVEKTKVASGFAPFFPHATSPHPRPFFFPLNIVFCCSEAAIGRLIFWTHSELYFLWAYLMLSFIFQKNICLFQHHIASDRYMVISASIRWDKCTFRLWVSNTAIVKPHLDTESLIRAKCLIFFSRTQKFWHKQQVPQLLLLLLEHDEVQ